MPDPLAYFLTWTCHGSWLPGDERGSVDRFHNVRGHELVPPDLVRRRLAKSLQRGSTITLSVEAREIVEQTVREHSRLRGWDLLAVNPRSTHVHLVVNSHGRVSPEDAMSQFKAWSTRRLRERGLVPPHAKVWTEHGSTRWINDPDSLHVAIDYVVRRQDERRWGPQ